MEKYQALHARSISDPDGFWGEQAALIDWETPYSQVLDYSRPPFAKWFVGGRTNLCHNAIDRHLAGYKNEIASARGRGKRTSLTIRSNRGLTEHFDGHDTTPCKKISPKRITKNY